MVPMATRGTRKNSPVVITVFNNKGGVGKTTLLCNLAASLKQHFGKRVLVIDADPQCNATAYLLDEDSVIQIYTAKAHNTVDKFMESLRRGKGYLDELPPTVISPRFEVDLLPGDPRLALSEDLLASDWKSGTSGDPRGLQTTFVFSDIVGRFPGYDFVLFDVGPSLGAINRAVLIASDFFLVPMSSDIFSLMAISNISLSLTKWRESLDQGLSSYKKQEQSEFETSGRQARWKLGFIGYVRQQYTAKAVKGKRQPVRAYDRILKQAPDRIQSELVEAFPVTASNFEARLGEIPNLHSIVPLSQTANAPIFALKGRDGVVGAHFAKVSEAETMIRGIASKLLANLG
jgi:cellulose biosynthesis protein BcsQ